MFPVPCSGNNFAIPVGDMHIFRARGPLVCPTVPAQQITYLTHLTHHHAVEMFNHGVIQSAKQLGKMRAQLG